MSAETEKYTRAWEIFQEKMASLRKKRSEMVAKIFKKLDDRRIEILRDKLKEHV